MELTFNWKNIKKRGKGLTFSDVLITPQKSDIRSRNEPELKTQLTKNTEIKLPFISANMDTITEKDMVLAMNDLGGLGILHRFMSIEEQAQQVAALKNSGCEIIAASIGVNQDFKERTEALVKNGAQILTIDIAHGHSIQMFETIQWVKSNFSNVEIIAGNVATPQATQDLIEAGADAIKVGIGPGSMCTTRIITGCGVPQLTAIALCAEKAQEFNVPIIADGGIRTSGDIFKCFAAGAQSVMLGSILAGTIETPGDIRNGKKQYRGMASKSAQVSWRGGVPNGMAPEGESTFVAVKGHVSDVINELSGGVRSGMSYVNAQRVSNIKDNAVFMEMSAQGHLESTAHGLKS